MEQETLYIGVAGFKSQWAPVGNGISPAGGLCVGACVCAPAHTVRHKCHKMWFGKKEWCVCHHERWWQGRLWHAHSGLLWKNQCSDWMTDCRLSLSLLRCNYWGGIAMFLWVINPNFTAQWRWWWPRPVEHFSCADPTSSWNYILIYFKLMFMTHVWLIKPVFSVISVALLCDNNNAFSTCSVLIDWDLCMLALAV